VVKAAALVAPSEPVHVVREGRRFVSRGGEKLDAALDRFRKNVAGARCLDAGSSTGGFTDCLLRRGAAHVIAVDVGYGQLAWRLREDPRVTVLERTNVRDLRLENLPYAPELITVDLSFISLRLAVPALAELAGGEASMILLVKPQFEAGPEHVGKGGVVRDPEVWVRALAQVSRACVDAGFGPVAATVSPLLGPAGNVEFFLHVKAGHAGIELDLGALAEEGEALRAAS
jgi:23S rRNA (cytidine1920-2'-O)/16S rRNA (cytidine1409-2'-O)-methyltransferase